MASAVEAPGLQRRVGVAFWAIVLAMVPGVLDQTILATALPTIASDLGRLAEVSWVATAYVVAATTITGSSSQEAQALTAYAQHIGQQLPVIFVPTQIGTYEPAAGTLVAKNLGGYTANALGLMNPEDWYFTK